MTKEQLNEVLSMNERDFFFRFGKLNISNKPQYEYLVKLRKNNKLSTASQTIKDALDIFPNSTLI